MKTYKIRSDYDCLVKHLEGESFLDVNSELTFEKPEKILVYPLTETNKSSYPFVIDLAGSDISRFFRRFCLKKFDLIYINSLPYIENEIIETVTLSNTECKVYVSENKIAFESQNQKKSFILKNKFDSYTIDSKENLLFLHLIGKTEDLWIFNAKNQKLTHLFGKKIERFENQIVLSNSLNDIACQEIYETFEVSETGLIKKNSKLKYESDTPKIVKNSAVVPVAFLQALKTNNFELAKLYLSKDLKESTSDEHLKNYFKKISRILMFDDGCIGVIDDDKLTVYRFVVSNGLISEIETTE